MRIAANTTVQGVQRFVRYVYGPADSRFFGPDELLSNVLRFTMRGLKGIRKGDQDKAALNLVISFAWFVSLMNTLDVDILKETWRLFPGICPYCRSAPCKGKQCKKRGGTRVPDLSRSAHGRRPTTLTGLQLMFNRIYPASARGLYQAGIHLAEEVGELVESFLAYKGTHKDKDFDNVIVESIDYLSCLLGTFSSLQVRLSRELAASFSNNCHVCHLLPCKCSFDTIVGFTS